MSTLSRSGARTCRTFPVDLLIVIVIALQTRSQNPLLFDRQLSIPSLPPSSRPRRDEGATSRPSPGLSPRPPASRTQKHEIPSSLWGRDLLRAFSSPHDYCTFPHRNCLGAGESCTAADPCKTVRHGLACVRMSYALRTGSAQYCPPVGSRPVPSPYQPVVEFHCVCSTGQVPAPANMLTLSRYTTVPARSKLN